MSTINKYKDVVILATVNILSGQINSSIFDCTTSIDVLNNGHGSSALREIVTPENWTPCDVTIKKYYDFGDGEIETLAYVNDFQDSNIITISCPVSLGSFAIPPFGSDCLKKISFVCSVPQVETVTLGLVLAPLYQGHA